MTQFKTINGIAIKHHDHHLQCLFENSSYKYTFARFKHKINGNYGLKNPRRGVNTQ